MKTLKAESTFGNFKWVAQAEVEDAVLEILANLGLLQVLQRSPASTAEKLMAGYGKKRPTDFKRSSIAFSEANAEILTKAMEAAELEVGELKVKLGIVAEVTEHIPGEGAEYKYVREKAQVAKKAGDEAKLLKLAEVVGYDEEDVELLTVENIEFLKAIRKYLDGFEI